MPSLTQNTVEQFLATLPCIENLTERNAVRKADIFICALGFEARCLSIPTMLSKTGFACRCNIMIRLDTNVDDNDSNFADLDSCLTSFGRPSESFNADDDSFEKKLRLKIADVGHTKDRPRVVLDISVTANRALLRTMKVLLEEHIELIVYYAEANAYHPTSEEYSRDPDKWKSPSILGTESGVSRLVPSASYSGQHIDALPHCVILLPSFRKDRSLAVISNVDETLMTTNPGNLYWLLGVPHLHQDRWRVNAMIEINEIPDGSHQIQVSTFEYSETIRQLELIHSKKWSNTNITISPIGSKLQAIGVAIFCFLRPEVRVIFSSPQKYNAKEWSDGCRDTWQIDFGDTKLIQERMNAVGCLVMLQ